MAQYSAMTECWRTKPTDDNRPDLSHHNSTLGNENGIRDDVGSRIEEQNLASSILVDEVLDSLGIVGLAIWVE